MGDCPGPNPPGSTQRPSSYPAPASSLLPHALQYPGNDISHALELGRIRDVADPTLWKLSVFVWQRLLGEFRMGLPPCQTLPVRFATQRLWLSRLYGYLSEPYK